MDPDENTSLYLFIELDDDQPHAFVALLRPSDLSAFDDLTSIYSVRRIDQIAGVEYMQNLREESFGPGGSVGEPVG